MPIIINQIMCIYIYIIRLLYYLDLYSYRKGSDVNICI